MHSRYCPALCCESTVVLLQVTLNGKKQGTYERFNTNVLKLQPASCTPGAQWHICLAAHLLCMQTVLQVPAKPL